MVLGRQWVRNGLDAASRFLSAHEVSFEWSQIIRLVALWNCSNLFNILDLKRLYAVRQALTLFDFTDSSASSIVDLLSFCYSSALFQKSADGRKFLAYAFTLDSELVTRFHATLKFQIPAAPKSLVDVFGEIYLKAWKLAKDDTLAQLG
jgi:hypothetical protein